MKWLVFVSEESDTAGDCVAKVNRSDCYSPCLGHAAFMRTRCWSYPQLWSFKTKQQQQHYDSLCCFFWLSFPVLVVPHTFAFHTLSFTCCLTMCLFYSPPPPCSQSHGSYANASINYYANVSVNHYANVTVPTCQTIANAAWSFPIFSNSLHYLKSSFSSLRIWSVFRGWWNLLIFHTVRLLFFSPLSNLDSYFPHSFFFSRCCFQFHSISLHCSYRPWAIPISLHHTCTQ